MAVYKRTIYNLQTYCTHSTRTTFAIVAIARGNTALRVHSLTRL